MSQPSKVSIVLPTRNSIRFLPVRLESITKQTMQSWELIIVDGYSSDGTWEYLNEFAESDIRVTVLEQFPVGLYESWNHALAKAQGEYVYIATSDDLMDAEALEVMVAALDVNPDCGICDSKLKVIDEKGAIIEGYAERLPIASYLASLRNVCHIRKCPHDAVIHLTGCSVFTSLTQIMFRRNLLETCGYFNPSWGSVSDFEWAFRLSLETNTFYIPRALSAWRKHTGQATAKNTRPLHLDKYAMAKSALKENQKDQSKTELIQQLNEHLDYLALQALRDTVRRSNPVYAFVQLFRTAIRRPRRSLEFLGEFINPGLRQKNKDRCVERLKKEFGLENLIQWR